MAMKKSHPLSCCCRACSDDWDGRKRSTPNVELCKMWHDDFGACELFYGHDGDHYRIAGGAKEGNWWPAGEEAHLESCEGCRTKIEETVEAPKKTILEAADKPTLTVRRSVMMEAEDLVNGPRRKDYGHPRDNFSRIIGGWNWWLEARKPGPLRPDDHAVMMIILKLARLAETPGHRDSNVDVVGYAGTYEMLFEDEA